MHIKFKREIKDRERIAKFVASCMGDSLGGFPPYKINSYEDVAWQVDRGNDWLVVFDDENFYIMRMQHRYRDLEASESLMRWIAFRTNSEIVEEAPR